MEPKQGIVRLYKETGETPLECVERYRNEHPELKDVALSYLGRLDPMAEGVLLVAVGDENKNREEYLGLDKEYEFEVLEGFSTDSYDLLGVAALRKSSSSLRPVVIEGTVSERTTFSEGVTPLQDIVLPSCSRNGNAFQNNILKRGVITQQYPPYSSKTVSGKPLWQWAREGKLNEIEIPTIEVEIYDVKKLGTRTISKEELLREIKAKIAKVKGDFRQAEVIESWKQVLHQNPQNSFIISSYFIACSAGTYVRSLANDMGGVAFAIKRTKVGKWD